MFIFNIWAIPVVLVVILACVGLEAVAPGITGGTSGNLIVGVVTVIIGGVADVFGIRGRVFFMPIWLIGLLIIGFQLFDRFGVWGLLAGLALVIGSVVALFKLSKRTETKRWETLQRGGFTEDAKFVETPVAFWAVVKKHLFSPRFLDYSAEVRAHNTTIVDAVLGRTDLGLSETEAGILKDYRAALNEPVDGAKPKPPASALVNAVEALVAKKASVARAR
jgi:hypothetical protein